MLSPHVDEFVGSMGCSPDEGVSSNVPDTPSAPTCRAPNGAPGDCSRRTSHRARRGRIRHPAGRPRGPSRLSVWTKAAARKIIFPLTTAPESHRHRSAARGRCPPGGPSGPPGGRTATGENRMVSRSTIAPPGCTPAPSKPGYRVAPRPREVHHARSFREEVQYPT